MTPEWAFFYFLLIVVVGTGLLWAGLWAYDTFISTKGKYRRSRRKDEGE